MSDHLTCSFNARSHTHSWENTNKHTHPQRQNVNFLHCFFYSLMFCATSFASFYFGCIAWLTQSVVCSRWVREGRVRRGTCSSETLCSDRPRPRVRGGAGSCWRWAQLMSRDRCWGKNSLFRNVKTCWVLNMKQEKTLLDDFLHCVFTWRRKVTMEKDTTTRRTVQLLTQHQAADCTHAHTDTRKVQRKSLL